MADEEVIRKGKEAEGLLNNPVIKDAFEGVRKQLENGWKNSKVNDQVLREECYRMLHCLEAVRTQLTTYVNGGKLLVAGREERQLEDYRTGQLKNWDGSPDGSTGH